jgi:hypothetical protein
MSPSYHHTKSCIYFSVRNISNNTGVLIGPWGTVLCGCAASPLYGWVVGLWSYFPQKNARASAKRSFLVSAPDHVHVHLGSVFAEGTHGYQVSDLDIDRRSTPQAFTNVSIAMPVVSALGLGHKKTALSRAPYRRIFNGNF